MVISACPLLWPLHSFSYLLYIWYPQLIEHWSCMSHVLPAWLFHSRALVLLGLVEANSRFQSGYCERVGDKAALSIYGGHERCFG